MAMAGKVKRLQVKVIMQNVMDRAAMRARKEKETFENIARFMDERGMKLEECFKYFETDGDGNISTEELKQGLITMKIPLNQQNLRMLVSVFDKNEDNRISIDEFEATMAKYMVKK